MSLPDAAVDRILLVHALEMSDDPEACCARCGACWRPPGRLIAVIPTAVACGHAPTTTPFGHGRPYSRAQITQFLRQTWSSRPHGPRPCSCRRSARLVPALGDGLGARRRSALDTVRRRPYRGSDQAGLSRDPRLSRTRATHSVVSRCWCRRRRHAGRSKSGSAVARATAHPRARPPRDSCNKKRWARLRFAHLACRNVSDAWRLTRCPD